MPTSRRLSREVPHLCWGPPSDLGANSADTSPVSNMDYLQSMNSLGTVPKVTKSLRWNATSGDSIKEIRCLL
jgi:hypothetical protein